MDKTTKRALTPDEFGNSYGVGRTKTYEEIKAGRLKAVKLGKKTLIRTDDAEQWLAGLRVGISHSEQVK